MISEKSPFADVLAYGVERFVPGLAHDGEFRDAVQVRLRRKTRPQAVPGVGGRIEPGGPRRLA